VLALVIEPFCCSTSQLAEWQRYQREVPVSPRQDAPDRSQSKARQRPGEYEESAQLPSRPRCIHAAPPPPCPTIRSASLAQQRSPRSAAEDGRHPKRRGLAEYGQRPCRQAGSRQGRDSEDRLACGQRPHVPGSDAQTGSRHMPAASARSFPPNCAPSAEGRHRSTTDPRSRHATQRRLVHRPTETPAPYRAPRQGDAS
jgi:hypothetical protein